jgi:putative tryptophan/tyrosine transport system substrate-binding protein
VDSSPRGRRRALHAAAGWLALVSAWPARGQGQAPRVLRIGVLGTFGPPLKDRGLWNALVGYGYIEGKNLEVERRWADGQLERLPALAAELVQSKVDIILALTTPDARAARQATAAVPILLYATGGDPVASGLVTSLSRPGGNITGYITLSAEMGVKRLELLKELLPRLSKAAWLSGSQATDGTRRAMQAAATVLRIDLATVEVRSVPDITATIAGMRSKGIEALVVLPTPLLNNNAALIAEQALQQRLPYAGVDGDSDRGALLGLSPDLSQMNPRMAYFIDRIARGAKPADLPIERPTRFKMSVNLGTARALGLKLSPAFLSRIDRTVE